MIRCLSSWFLRRGYLAVPLLASLTLPPGVRAQEGEPVWRGSVSLNQYFFPQDPDILTAVGVAERGALHLEGRWNYEERRAGSFFVGGTFAFGDRLAVEATPMAGVVFGQLTGVAPGLEATISMGPASWYSEAEYVLDLGDGESSFFYVWSQLGVTIEEGPAVGLVGQRLRVRAAPRELERGFYLEVPLTPVLVGGYVFQPWADDWFAVVSLVFEL